MAGLMGQACNVLDRYFQDIASLKPLSTAEELELAKQIHAGDQEARNRLVSANLKFVVSVASEYRGCGAALEDMISAGNVGLIMAAERFDETKGFKFISYAVWWIRHAIRQSLSQDARMVRLPMNRIELLHSITHAAKELCQFTEAEPDPEALAEVLGVSVKMVRDTLMRAQEVLSLEASFQKHEGHNLLDVLPDHTQEAPDARMERDSNRKQVGVVLATLKDREAEVLRLYFGLGEEEPLTLDEIGTQLNRTGEWVRQIKDRALRKLRHPRRRTQLTPLMESV